MLSKRLGDLIDSLKVTHGQFAIATGIELQRVHNLTLGRVKKLKTQELQTIRRVYGVNPEWLVSGDGERDVAAGQSSIKDARAAVAKATQEVADLSLQASDKVAVEQLLFAVNLGDSFAVQKALRTLRAKSDLVLVPRHEVQASAGHGALVHDESIVDHLSFRREWITQTLGCSPEAICVIQASGDSMAPTIKDADLLLLDTRPGMPNREGVYVIQLSGALLVKRLRFRLSGVVDVQSDNAQYASESVSAQDLERLTIVGRVVWHGSKI